MKILHVKANMSRLFLGRRGENLARALVFDVGDWVRTYGDGTIQALHQRAQDTAPYPCAVTREGNLATWVLTAADTAQNGYGKLELHWYLGEVHVKSCVYITEVAECLTDDTADPPEPAQGWVDRVMAAVNDLDAKITGAVADYLAEHPIEVESLVSSVNGKEGAVVLKAEDVGALSTDALGEAVNDALAEAKASGVFDGAAGAAGKDGTSVTHAWDGTVLKITSASGTSSADLKGDTGEKGDTGATGAPGYTPVKGTDYFTDADKTEMVNAVIAALPTWNGGSY